MELCFASDVNNYLFAILKHFRSLKVSNIWYFHNLIYNQTVSSATGAVCMQSKEKIEKHKNAWNIFLYN